jgi:hypothetical protein
MSIHLVIPGLVWPAATATNLTRGLALPALQALLGHARVTSAPAMSLEAWLGQAFGLPPEDLPHAALRRLGEADRVAVDGEWLCADPVHLHFARERLLLSDASDLALTSDEVAALLASLNDFFDEAEPGLGRFEAGSPERWYLHLAEPVRARFVPLNDVVGRPVAPFLPEGEDARRWQRLVSEAQILLHDHPVNRAREAAGGRAINSLWLWGGGRLPARVAAPARTVQAHAVFARGLARAAGLEPVSPHPLPADDALVVLDALQLPALHLDIERWQQALLRLEAEWFAPLLTALKAGRTGTLRISVPGDRTSLELALGAASRWKFWQRPRTLDSLNAILP